MAASRPLGEGDRLVGISEPLYLGLTLVFIYLRMTGQLALSWFWVLSPLFIPWMIAIAVVLIATLIGGLIEALR